MRPRAFVAVMLLGSAIGCPSKPASITREATSETASAPLVASSSTLAPATSTWPTARPLGFRVEYLHRIPSDFAASMPSHPFRHCFARRIEPDACAGDTGEIDHGSCECRVLDAARGDALFVALAKEDWGAFVGANAVKVKPLIPDGSTAILVTWDGGGRYEVVDGDVFGGALAESFSRIEHGVQDAEEP